MTDNHLKKTSDSRTEQVYMLRQQHINGYGRLFGGTLMQWIDELAGIVAKRHAQTEVTTAAIDNLSFISVAALNDTLVLVGTVSYVGKTSMEIRVDTYVEDLTGQRRLINKAYVVMVAIDASGAPASVPGLLVETAHEKLEWAAGKKRYALRKQRRIEGY